MSDMRVIVEQIRTREILTRDLDARDLKVGVNLSAPAKIEFTMPQQGPGGEEIKLKPYGHIIHVEDTWPVLGRVIIASGIVKPSDLDDSGNMAVTAEGFSGYPTKMPWLQNWNPVVVDPFQVWVKIWDHLQSYDNGNLNVEIYPTSSGTYMLPGFSFDGIELNIDFFAMFIRSADLRDCGDELNSLARDIPFDFLEQQAWNAGRTQIDKKIQLAYPRRGVRRAGLSFRLGENVISAKPKAEAEIEWCSDIIVKGWFPGKMYSSQFTNAPADRIRRVIKEDDAMINSNERAQVWAKRKLTRRQVPDYWEQVVIDAFHPHGPIYNFEVGDEILIEGYMPFVGQVSEWHRVMGYQWDGSGRAILALKHEGAFNYDPVEYTGS